MIIKKFNTKIKIFLTKKIYIFFFIIVFKKINFSKLMLDSSSLVNFKKIASIN